MERIYFGDISSNYRWNNSGKTINDMVGQTFDKVYQCENSDGNDALVFENSEGIFVFSHWQDCCEYVHVEDITGDLKDLIGSPLLVAAVESEDYPKASESGTWTFYKFATIKGWVDVRFYGSSNGYYSEDVSLNYVSKKDVQ